MSVAPVAGSRKAHLGLSGAGAAVGGYKGSLSLPGVTFPPPHIPHTLAG